VVPVVLAYPNPKRQRGSKEPLRNSGVCCSNQHAGEVCGQIRGRFGFGFSAYKSKKADLFQPLSLASRNETGTIGTFQDFTYGRFEHKE
jgi:hypothetical protein